MVHHQKHGHNLFIKFLEIAAKYNEKIPTKSEDIEDDDNDES